MGELKNLSASDPQGFEFQPDSEGRLNLRDAVFQAIGAASVCWSKDGVFLSDDAVKIGEALLDFFYNQDTPARSDLDRLEAFVINEVPGEPSESEGLVDTVIRIIRAKL